ncbi:MAG: four helix bundle protein [Bacteroidales bacterium]|nr:four helix bundle protein [Bacteroidales bacterium]
MKFERFEEMIVWQNSQELALNIYLLFKENKDFSFVDQIKRAAISISNNIAEGFERKTNNEFKYFLFVAKGSAGEIRNMLYIAKKLNYLNQDKFDKLFELSSSISKMLSTLIKTL